MPTTRKILATFKDDSQGIFSHQIIDFQHGIIVEHHYFRGETLKEAWETFKQAVELQFAQELE